MTLFEVFLAPGQENDALLSDEVRESSGAQIFTPEEAAFVGLEGIPEDPQGRPRKLIAVGAGDERLIASRLEANGAVASFRQVELG